ncbi:Kynurenine formamidase [Sporothrix curviconia]|uniref:Kynurenine formamidase n=1 Tax=Sporothrix curviconia TaxID=1260050 RepID=A0ABP0C3L7_9PEZI
MAGLSHRQIRYGSESELQFVDVWELATDEREAATSSNRYWFIYIHGGAWRDPRCLTDTYVPAVDRLLAADSPYLDRSRIAGFASIGYRLSPHPEFPQNPATTPAEKLRVARHPDHINDVRAGLAALAEDGDARNGSPADYLAHNRYIVYGHSCGGFLAFQLWAEDGNDETKQPPCIVGLEGIYDLRGFVERGGSPEHGGGPGTEFAAALETIAEGAFGRDRVVWDRASPARYDFTRLSRASAPKDQKPRLAIVAYSPEDELVDGGEMDSMERALQHGVAKSGGGLVYVGIRDLHGRHDEVHEDGREVARVLTEAVKQLDRL